ncbi:GNAT family N-acetyltransferase [Paradevosia shaoguanensis]|uniref:GNAT family N-acetyltransferase n=1 Tax=Paradevosia shaoguanensis TaxID=1335043 RepID=UPI0035E3C687
MTGSAIESIEPASRDDLPEVAEVLAQAFFDDPELRAFINGGDRARRLRAYLLAEARLSLENGGAVDIHRGGNGEVVGAAIWEAPYARETLLRTVRYGPTMLGAVRLRGLLNWLTHRSEFERFQPTSPHWHLVRIGTAENMRGQGVGTALLKGRLAVVDGKGDVAHLESSSPMSEGLYRRLGFEAVGSFKLPYGALIVPMTRPSQLRPAVVTRHP